MKKILIVFSLFFVCLLYTQSTYAYEQIPNTINVGDISNTSTYATSDWPLIDAFYEVYIPVTTYVDNEVIFYFDNGSSSYGNFWLILFYDTTHTRIGSADEWDYVMDMTTNDLDYHVFHFNEGDEPVYIRFYTTDTTEFNNLTNFTTYIDEQVLGYMNIFEGSYSSFIQIILMTDGLGYNQGYFDGSLTGYDTGYIDGQITGSDLGYVSGYNTALDDVYDDGIAFTDNSYDDTNSYDYIAGLDEGIDEGIIEGHNDILDDGAFAHGFVSSDAFDYAVGSSTGYALGLEDGYNFNPTGFIQTLFYGIGYLFAVELIPGLKIGTIALMVLMLKLLPFIIGLFSGGKKD